VLEVDAVDEYLLVYEPALLGAQREEGHVRGPDADLGSLRKGEGMSGANDCCEVMLLGMHRSKGELEGQLLHRFPPLPELVHVLHSTGHAVRLREDLLTQEGRGLGEVRRQSRRNGTLQARHRHYLAELRRKKGGCVVKPYDPWCPSSHLAALRQIRH
jgi:hypothetical protein